MTHNKPMSAARAPSTVRRKSVSSTLGDWVRVEPMFEDEPYPTLVEATVEDLNLAEWARHNTEWVRELYAKHRSLLFRGFAIDGFEGPRSFGAFVDTVSEGPRLPYLDRTTPRKDHGDKLYCTTVFPPDQTMAQHNEGSYWTAWSLKAFMYCVTAPDTGGATPVADVNSVHDRIDPSIREEFARRGWQLVRNFNDGFGLPWQDVFQTTDKAEVEKFCAANRIRPEWKDGDRLRTRQTRPAIRFHPRTGEPLWFNHIGFYHISSRPAAVRDALLEDFGIDELPFNTVYGDGGAIADDVIAQINDAYVRELISWPWLEGDVHLFDNMRLSHGREPFTGDRLILVALTEGYQEPEDIMPQSTRTVP